MAKLQEELLIKRLTEAAWKARNGAYAPYSNFFVGAALYLPDLEEIVVGVNVENASYGATICAERSALVSSQSRFGKQKIGAIAVATDAADPAVPCALCLQVLAEFCQPTVPIYLVNSKGIQKKYLLSDLLPYPFTSFVPNV